MKRLLIVFISFVLLVACSSPQTNKKEPIHSSKPAKAATDLQGMLKEGPGKYAGNKYDQKKLEAELDKLPNNMTVDQAYNYLISLLAEDYKPIVSRINQFDASISGPSPGPDGNISSPNEMNKKLNIEILLDSSGSMAEKIDGQTKMDLAKQAINQFVSSIPQGANVALRVYGHKGSNQDKDKSLSCSSSEVVYPLNPYDNQEFGQSLQRFQPTGWTPLALAIRSAQQDLSEQSNAENILYIVSDGIETCGGNPVQEAQKLHNSNVKAVVNIIGFDVDNAGQQALQKVAQSGGGTYYTVNNEEDLKEYFNKQYNELSEKWSLWRGNFSEQAADELGRKSTELGNIILRKAFPMLDTEYSRFQAAVDYLSNKNKVKDSIALSQKLSDRYNKIHDYFNNKYNELDNKLSTNWNKKLEEADRIKQDAQNQIDKQRGN